MGVHMHICGIPLGRLEARGRWKHVDHLRGQVHSAEGGQGQPHQGQGGSRACRPRYDCVDRPHLAHLLVALLKQTL